ncbi:hypothetical protein DdX_04661 [Ditylenchus destructor]|uniref:Uncharacterized protein n=1 Tax=Ditylenchus destructor TaxID=166010 RepID=A0AAD4RBA6_9BILA|nr:hypothetical protein DdX_04661 [Ditylenchus destructor]
MRLINGYFPDAENAIENFEKITPPLKRLSLEYYDDFYHVVVTIVEKTESGCRINPTVTYVINVQALPTQKDKDNFGELVGATKNGNNEYLPVQGNIAIEKSLQLYAGAMDKLIGEYNWIKILTKKQLAFIFLEDMALRLNEENVRKNKLDGLARKINSAYKEIKELQKASKKIS